MQIKLWQFFTHSFETDFSKPEHKFIHQSLFGILKDGHVQINTIGRSLQEKISTKKLAKRLSYHLVKENMAEKINRKRLGALLQFVYYKLALAVKRILVLARVYYPPRRINFNNG